VNNKERDLKNTILNLTSEILTASLIIALGLIFLEPELLALVIG
jgi:hypothetical protein